MAVVMILKVCVSTPTQKARIKAQIKAVKAAEAAEALNYLVLLRKKFNYIGSIPRVLLPYPLSSSEVAASASSAAPC